MRPIKAVFVLFLIFAAVGFGAYDHTAVNVNYGFGFIDSVAATGGHGLTAANPSLTFGCTGTLTGLKIYMRSTTANACALAKLKIMSGTPGSFVLESEVSILTQVAEVKPAAVENFILELTGLSLPVEPDHFLANCLDTSVTYAIKNPGLMTYYYGNGDTAVLGASATYDICWEATISTSDKIIYTGSTWTAGETAHIQSYDASPFYIVVEGVQVPDTETLAFTLQYTDATTDATATEETYTIDYSGGAGDGTVKGDAATTASIAGQEGDKINYYIYINPATGKQDLYFCNYTDGAGGQGDTDIKHVSLNSRGLANITAANKLRRIGIVNAGGNATADRIVVCREPVVAGFDSYVSMGSGGVLVLGRVGAYLDDAGVFTEQRHVINGGIPGNLVTDTTESSYTAIKTRWNSSENDLCGFRDVVYVFVNGPGLNDVASLVGEASTDIEIDCLAYQIAGEILTMAGDVLSTKIDGVTVTSNDLVLCGMVPYTANSGQEEINEMLCQQRVNELLEVAAYRLGVPFVDCWGLASYTDGTHYTDAGNALVAERIATAYENNQVPNNPFGSSGSRGFNRF